MNMDLHTFVGTEYIQGTTEDIILEVGGSYSLGDFQAYRGEVTEALKKSLFILPGYMSGSDYSGGILAKCNFETFMKLYDKLEGVYKIYGGYNTYGVAIRLDVYENNENVKETIDKLEEYPIIDEEDYSNLEIQWQEEFISSERDFFCRQIDLEDHIPEIETFLEDEETIEGYMWEAIRDLEMDFSYDDTSAWVDLDKVRPYVEDRLIIEHADKLPLFINRPWTCTVTEQMFKDKLTGDVK